MCHQSEPVHMHTSCIRAGSNLSPRLSTAGRTRALALLDILTATPSDLPTMVAARQSHCPVRRTSDYTLTLSSSRVSALCPRPLPPPRSRSARPL